MNNSKVQALATWYNVNQNGKFFALKSGNIFYVDIKDYTATIAEPQFNDKEIFITGETLSQIENCLIRLKK